MLHFNYYKWRTVYMRSVPVINPVDIEIMAIMHDFIILLYSRGKQHCTITYQHFYCQQNNLRFKRGQGKSSMHVSWDEPTSKSLVRNNWYLYPLLLAGGIRQAVNQSLKRKFN